MSKLANMFAVLNLDAEDDREEAEKPASSKAEADAAHRKPGKSALSSSPARGCQHALNGLYRAKYFGGLAALRHASQFVN